MKLFLTLSLCLALSSCSTVTPKRINFFPELTIDAYHACQPVGFIFDKEISAQAYHAAVQAIIYWNKTLGCEIFFLDPHRPALVIYDTLPEEIKNHPSVQSLTKTKENLKIVGLAQRYVLRHHPCVISADIYINQDVSQNITNKQLQNAYRHELAHILGLIDIDNKSELVPTLMGGFVRTYNHLIDVEPEDLKYLKNLHCSPFFND